MWVCRVYDKQDRARSDGGEGCLVIWEYPVTFGVDEGETGEEWWWGVGGLWKGSAQSMVAVRVEV